MVTITPFNGARLSKALSVLFFAAAAPFLYAQGEEILGSGPFVTLPGRHGQHRQVMNQDIARSKAGDYFWREVRAGQNGKIEYTDRKTGKTWGYLYLVPGDITYAQKNNFMANFKPSRPDIDSSGEKFMVYKKNTDYSRKLFDKGTVEDVITKSAEFDKALAEFRKKYPNPIPRKNTAIAGAKNWLYLNDVGGDFPRTFWASITLEGRVMKVIIANGPGSRLAVSYWAQDSFMQEFPNATWSWKGEDMRRRSGARRIQEDISQTAAYYEYSK
ncbi:MAG: hypothetical protein LBD07_01655 [Spirochaetaceae bacterium]|jgi:hypothetical protein|nr:hypothetical protein [Spirochaetaceae bacterium]